MLLLRSLGDDARATLERCRRQLIQSKVNLGDVYSKFILGLGHEESHHLQGGRYVSCKDNCPNFDGVS